AARPAGPPLRPARAEGQQALSASSGIVPPFFQPLANPGHEAAHVHELVHKRGERLTPILVPLAEVPHYALFQVDLELIAFGHPLGSLRRLEDGVAQVDSVAKEDPRVGVGDDERYARTPDRNRGDLARGAASEVGSGHEDVPRRHLRRPALSAWQALHRVLAELLLIQRIDRVLGRDDLVGIDVGPELPGPAPDDRGEGHAIPAGIFFSTSPGWVMTPVTALAAATAGLDR